MLLTTGAAMADPVLDHSWRFFSDQVMGGISTGQADIGTDGLRLSGDVSTANNGGFIQAQTKTGAFDAGDLGLVLRVRGDGQRYFIHLRTSGTRLPWQFYQAAFDTNGTWQEITLRWADFAPSGRLLRRVPRPGDIRSVALVAYGRDHRADVTLQRFAPLR